MADGLALKLEEIYSRNCINNNDGFERQSEEKLIKAWYDSSCRPQCSKLEYYLNLRKTLLYVFVQSSIKESTKLELGKAISAYFKTFASSFKNCSEIYKPIMNVIAEPWRNAFFNWEELLQKRLVIKNEQVQLYFASEPEDVVVARVHAFVIKGFEEGAMHLAKICFLYHSRIRKNNKDDNSKTEKNCWKKGFPSLDWYLFFLKKKSLPVIVSESEQFSCHEKVQMIRRLKRSRNNQDFAFSLLQIFLMQELVHPSKYCCTKKLFHLWSAMHKERGSGVYDILQAVRKIFPAHSPTSAHFYLLVDALDEQFGSKLVLLYIELYIRGLTSDLNYLEYAKHVNVKIDMNFVESHIASVFAKLSTLFNDFHEGAARECMFSAFSLKPTKERLYILQSLTHSILSAENETKRNCTTSTSLNSGSCKCNSACNGSCKVLKESIFEHPLLTKGISKVPYVIVKDLVTVLESVRCTRFQYNIFDWRNNATDLGDYLNEFILFKRYESDTDSATEDDSKKRLGSCLSIMRLPDTGNLPANVQLPSKRKSDSSIINGDLISLNVAANVEVRTDDSTMKKVKVHKGTPTDNVGTAKSVYPSTSSNSSLNVQNAIENVIRMTLHKPNPDTPCKSNSCRSGLNDAYDGTENVSLTSVNKNNDNYVYPYSLTSYGKQTNLNCSFPRNSAASHICASTQNVSSLSTTIVTSAQAVITPSLAQEAVALPLRNPEKFPIKPQLVQNQYVSVKPVHVPDGYIRKMHPKVQNSSQNVHTVNSQAIQYSKKTYSSSENTFKNQYNSSVSVDKSIVHNSDLNLSSCVPKTVSSTVSSSSYLRNYLTSEGTSKKFAFPLKYAPLKTPSDSKNERLVMCSSSETSRQASSFPEKQLKEKNRSSVISHTLHSVKEPHLSNNSQVPNQLAVSAHSTTGEQIRSMPDSNILNLRPFTTSVPDKTIHNSNIFPAKLHIQRKPSDSRIPLAHSTVTTTSDISAISVPEIFTSTSVIVTPWETQHKSHGEVMYRKKVSILNHPNADRRIYKNRLNPPKCEQSPNLIVSNTSDAAEALNLNCSSSDVLAVLPLNLNIATTSQQVSYASKPQMNLSSQSWYSEPYPKPPFVSAVKAAPSADYSDPPLKQFEPVCSQGSLDLAVYSCIQPQPNNVYPQDFSLSPEKVFASSFSDSSVKPTECPPSFTVPKSQLAMSSSYLSETRLAAIDSYNTVRLNDSLNSNLAPPSIATNENILVQHSQSDAVSNSYNSSLISPSLQPRENIPIQHSQPVHGYTLNNNFSNSLVSQPESAVVQHSQSVQPHDVNIGFTSVPHLVKPRENVAMQSTQLKNSSGFMSPLLHDHKVLESGERSPLAFVALNCSLKDYNTTCCSPSEANPCQNCSLPVNRSSSLETPEKIAPSQIIDYGKTMVSDFVPPSLPSCLGDSEAVAENVSTRAAVKVCDFCLCEFPSSELDFHINSFHIEELRDNPAAPTNLPDVVPEQEHRDPFHGDYYFQDNPQGTGTGNLEDETKAFHACMDLINNDKDIKKLVQEIDSFEHIGGYLPFPNDMGNCNIAGDVQDVAVKIEDDDGDVQVGVVKNATVGAVFEFSENEEAANKLIPSKLRGQNGEAMQHPLKESGLPPPIPSKQDAQIPPIPQSSAPKYIKKIVWACPVCSKKLCSAGNLRRHIASFHPNCNIDRKVILQLKQVSLVPDGPPPEDNLKDARVRRPKSMLLKCEFCNKRLTALYMRKHILTQHCPSMAFKSTAHQNSAAEFENNEPESNVTHHALQQSNAVAENPAPSSEAADNTASSSSQPELPNVNAMSCAFEQDFDSSTCLSASDALNGNKPYTMSDASDIMAEKEKPNNTTPGAELNFSILEFPKDSGRLECIKTQVDLSATTSQPAAQQKMDSGPKKEEGAGSLESDGKQAKEGTTSGMLPDPPRPEENNSVPAYLEDEDWVVAVRPFKPRCVSPEKSGVNFDGRETPAYMLNDLRSEIRPRVFRRPFSTIRRRRKRGGGRFSLVVRSRRGTGRLPMTQRVKPENAKCSFCHNFYSNRCTLFRHLRTIHDFDTNKIKLRGRGSKVRGRRNFNLGRRVIKQEKDYLSDVEKQTEFLPKEASPKSSDFAVPASPDSKEDASPPVEEPEPESIRSSLEVKHNVSDVCDLQESDGSDARRKSEISIEFEAGEDNDPKCEVSNPAVPPQVQPVSSELAGAPSQRLSEDCSAGSECDDPEFSEDSKDFTVQSNEISSVSEIISNVTKCNMELIDNDKGLSEDNSLKLVIPENKEAPSDEGGFRALAPELQSKETPSDEEGFKMSAPELPSKETPSDEEGFQTSAPELPGKETPSDEDSFRMSGPEFQTKETPNDEEIFRTSVSEPQSLSTEKYEDLNSSHTGANFSFGAEKSHVCKLCDQNLNSTTSLSEHLKVFHKIPVLKHIFELSPVNLDDYSEKCSPPQLMGDVKSAYLSSDALSDLESSKTSGGSTSVSQVVPSQSSSQTEELCLLETKKPQGNNCSLSGEVSSSCASYKIQELSNLYPASVCASARGRKRRHSFSDTKSLMSEIGNLKCDFRGDVPLQLAVDSEQAIKKGKVETCNSLPQPSSTEEEGRTLSRESSSCSTVFKSRHKVRKKLVHARAFDKAKYHRYRVSAFHKSKYHAFARTPVKIRLKRVEPTEWSGRPSDQENHSTPVVTFREAAEIAEFLSTHRQPVVALTPLQFPAVDEDLAKSDYAMKDAVVRLERIPLPDGESGDKQKLEENLVDSLDQNVSVSESSNSIENLTILSSNLYEAEAPDLYETFLQEEVVAEGKELCTLFTKRCSVVLKRTTL